MNSTISKYARNAVIGVSITAAALCGAAGLAYADTAYSSQTNTDGTTVYYDSGVSTAALPTASVSTASTPTAAASRAAMSAPDILGLANVEESGQFVTFYTDDENVMHPVYTWSAPKYLLQASNYNSSPNSYLVNYALGLSANAAVYNPSRSGGGAGPNAALSSSDSTDKAILDMNPTVIIGSGGAETSGKVVNYNVSNYTTLQTTVTDIATASGSSTVQANATAYCNYITQTFAATQAVTEDRYFALIAGVTDDGDYILGSAGVNGTAANNRYLETCESAGALNLASIVSDASAVPAKTYTDTSGVVHYGLDHANVILIGGQQSDSTYNAAINQLFDDELLNSAYFTKDNGSYGATYGVVMNSIENVQNIGRILEALYPEVVNQQDYLAYYYEHFYHISHVEGADYLSTVMDNALDGVRNWNRSIDDYSKYDDAAEAVEYLTDWDVSECGYSSASAETALEASFGNN